MTQYWALEALERSGTLTLNELAAQLYLDKSTTSRVMNALERKGLAQRLPDPDDRRAVRILPTEAGARLADTVAGELVNHERAILAEFPEDLRRSLIDLVGQLGRIAEGRIETKGGSCCCLDC